VPEPSLTGSQLDRLGERLRDGPLVLADLQHLSRFLETLEPFAEDTFRAIRNLDQATPTLPPAQITRRNVKTVRSIIAKLRRQSTTTLRQMQDLVGCRIVVPDISDQEKYASALQRVFPDCQVVDRRQTPQHGYRAIHIIVRAGPRRFEIQLRTGNQDGWANLVEKLADRLGSEVKYGGGDPELQGALSRLSQKLADIENTETGFDVRPELQTSASQSAVYLYNTEAFVALRSINAPLDIRSSFLVRTAGSSAIHRAIVAELWRTFGSDWGTVFEYVLEFDDGSRVEQQYVRALEKVDIMYQEAGDIYDWIEGWLS
jgi:putative GTP pyrophosphokinase